MSLLRSPEPEPHIKLFTVPGNQRKVIDKMLEKEKDKQFRKNYILKCMPSMKGSKLKDYTFVLMKINIYCFTYDSHSKLLPVVFI